ncbi:NAD-dependent epimerase/dehydratase family protein [Brevundimonas sp.]|uniref:NAD-dependent epimerase/dehydratase family protein n=1 Tax=Brevundimonas sp. TaxID=1871086 RepID=UPI0035AF197E
MSEEGKGGRVLIFGAGYLGEALLRRLIAQGRAVSATSRDQQRRGEMEARGAKAIDPGDAETLRDAVAEAAAILVTAPPEAGGCPGARALLPALSASGAYPDWIGYVSSTAVYGDRAGGWAFEGDALNAASLEGARRVKAEREWLDAGQGMGLTVQVFRLPAIYGPARSPIDKLKRGDARLIRKPGQVFNRIHVEDAVDGLLASMRRPRPGAIYNLTDDTPEAADVVMAWTAERLGLSRPPEIDWTDAEVSDGMRRFYLDSKRVSNALAKAELGWRPHHADWRDGIAGLID